jgi:type I phosphodiesterase/nucleotide pyrophosphatase
VYFAAVIGSIVGVRDRVLTVLHEAAGRDVVVLAVDGVGHRPAARFWTSARVELLRSVFPTTSSAAWLSSLTGLEVADHGVPGVVFELPELGNVYEYVGPALGSGPNLFSDAAALGYHAVSVPADLEEFPGAWLDRLVEHSTRLPGHRFYWPDAGAYRPPELGALDRRLRDAIAAGRAVGSPALVWVFVEVDRHIHRHGYDAHVEGFLALVDRLGADLAGSGAVVLAYADHGQVPTRHDPALAALLDRLAGEHGCRMGGAGRTRWLYLAAEAVPRVRAMLERELPAQVRVEAADQVFRPGSVARGRVGPLVLTALGTDFLAPPGYRYEHGSRTAAELDVPFACWRP